MPIDIQSECYQRGKEIDQLLQSELTAKIILEQIRSLIKYGTYPERTLERIKEIVN